VSLPENAVIFIESAEQVGDFTPRLSINDGVVRTVDFNPFLRQSRNPLIQAYLDPAAFSSFSVKNGDLVWGGYDLCFPVADLYEGRV
jgi:hypothetical protein